MKYRWYQRFLGGSLLPMESILAVNSNTRDLCHQVRRLASLEEALC